MKPGLLCAAAALVVLSGPSESFRGVHFPLSHEAGAPPGHSGAPGEPTCHACHNDLELNEPSGGLQVVDYPERYEAGGAYVVSLILNSDEMVRSGFQAAVSAGELLPVDHKTTLVSDSTGQRYIGHSGAGSIPATPNRTLWTFEWVAPAEVGRVVSLSAAANSGNGDNSPMGDFIYTVQAQSR